MIRKMHGVPAYDSQRPQRKLSFKQRYDEAERRRSAAMQRLAGLNDTARAHSAYRRAATLLNQTFRKVSVAQRLAVLQAAEWLIDVLESLTPFL